MKNTYNHLSSEERDKIAYLCTKGKSITDIAKAKDHRIRVLFPTKINTEYSFAEGQFSVNQRQIDLPSGKDWEKCQVPHIHNNHLSVLMIIQMD